MLELIVNFLPGCFVVLMVIFFTLNFAPLFLFYPATLVASLLLLVKTAAVFVHTKQVQKWSVMVSSAEGTFESAYQFVFMFFIWFNGGQRELLSMFASLTLHPGGGGAQKVTRTPGPSTGLCQHVCLQNCTALQKQEITNLIRAVMVEPHCGSVLLRTNKQLAQLLTSL